MTPRPDDIDPIVLDWLYGLLDPAEAADVAAKVAADPDWAAAHERVAKAQGLMAAAAKSAFPAVVFTPPVELVTAPARKSAARVSMLSVWTKWAVAASLLLAFAGFGVPALIDAIGYKAYRGPVDRELAAVTAAKKNRDDAVAARKARQDEVEGRLAKATKTRETLEANWIAEEVKAVNQGASQPFSVSVNGPTTAVPGALNEYTIAVTDKQNKPYPVTVEVAVKDAAGKEIHARKFDPEKNPDGNKFRLPATVWEKVPAGSELFLAISAVDQKTGARSDLTENLRMLEPTFTTFLTTDKPMYRPGETVYFRSLTLDRFRFLPPTTELPLKFVVLKPDGTELSGSQTTGLAKPTYKAKDGLVDQVLGPDGKPVRGVGTGTVALGGELPGGEYVLQVWELPRPDQPPTANKSKPLAVRKFLVNNFTPPTFQKKLEWVGRSFGPGDTVGFTLECTDQANPLAGAPLQVAIEADGTMIKPTRVPSTLDKDGKAFVEFKLPAGVDEIKRATVTATVVKVVPESLVKSVPLATRKMSVEYFPEGGDLIAGVPNRVYFRATTSMGKPAEITGWLTDGTKDIARVATLNDPAHPGVNQGLGAFEFTPEPGVAYAVRLDTPSGIVQPRTVLGKSAVAAGVGGLFAKTSLGYPLPAAKADGIAMTVPAGVSKPGEPITVRLHPAGKTAKKVFVGAYTRGQAIAHAKADLTAGQPTDVTLDPGAVKLGGVTRITVFDLPAEDAAGRDDLKPLVERLVFRQPGERLNLSFAVKRNGKVLKPGEYLTPGAAVELEVQSKDESGAGKPAVLWTAVVNNSVIVDADEKTRHALPTHFLLTGEVQKGDELEHSDFLLTDHPKAAAGLDLLLGTQGWRRFAEQPNAEFRQKVPAELKEQLQLVSATNGPIPTGWQPQFRRVFDDYWPKYEASLIELESAQQAAWEYRASGDPDADVRKAEAERLQKLAEFGTVAADLEPFDNSITRRGRFLPVLLGFLVVAAIGLFALRSFALKPTESARTPLLLGGIGLLLLAALTGGTMLVRGDDDGWRALARDPSTPKPRRGDEMFGMKVASAPMPMADGNMAPKAAAGLGVAPRDARRAAEAERFAIEQGGAGWGDGGGFGPGGPPMPGGMPMGGGGGRGGGKGGRPGFAPGAGGPLPPAMPAGPGFAPPPGPVPLPAAAAPKAMPLDRNQMDPAKAGEARNKNGQDRPALQLPVADAKRDPQPGKPVAAVAPIAPAGRPAAARFGEMPGQPGGFADEPGEGLGWMPGRGLAQLDEKQVQDVFNRAKVEFREKRKQVLADALEKSANGKGAADRLRQMNFDAAGLVENMLPRLSPLPVREYAHARAATATDKREDFTETLLWQPVLVTPVDGIATVTFALSDQVNPYEVLIAGHTLDGRLGSASGIIEVRKAFSLGTKLPAEIGSSDKIDLPIVAANEADAVRTAEVALTLDGLQAESNTLKLDLGAGTGGRKLVRVSPTKTEGTLGLKLDGIAGQLPNADTDSFTHRAVTVVPDGYPVSGEKSDVLEKSVSLKLAAPKMVVPGSMKARVTVYPNTLSEIQAGLDGLLREPNGCFEQTSTTNYPNVLVLDYLSETNQAKPEVAKRAKDLLDRGYAKLTSFECQVPSDPSRKGYEWFGGTAPPHEALTAYGLLQFTDMSRVHPVDAEMMARTKKYLLGQRDGNGGFARNTRALDTFGRAPDHITNAYIVWALTEAEKKQAEKSDLSKEIAALQKKAEGSKDPYFLSLVANSLLNVGKRADAEKLLKAVGEMQAKDGSIPGAETSVTTSSGQALLIETTGLAVLGWLKANDTGTYRKNVDAAARWIGTQRGGYGGFGSTQSTILALKALIDYARSNKRPAESGWVKVSVAGKEIAKKNFTTEQAGPIVLDLPDAEKLLATGEAELSIETSAAQSYPVTASWEARTRQPLSSDKCAVSLTTKLTAAEVAEAASVRLDVTMSNLQDKGQGMAVAIIGLPAGLSLPQDLKQLKELTRRPVDDTEPKVSFFEIRGRELVLYWRGMSAKQTVEVSLDLIAETPGEFKGPASRAYLYYGAEHKQWIAPLDVTVKAK